MVRCLSTNGASNNVLNTYALHLHAFKLQIMLQSWPSCPRSRNVEAVVCRLHAHSCL